MSPSDDGTEVQSSEEGDQSIASRTRLQLARQWPPTIALPTESSPLEQHPQAPITHTDLNDPPPTPHLTNGNSLTGLQDRQRAPLKHSRRCLENYTRNDSSTSETLDEEVDYVGLLASTQFHTPIRIMRGVHIRMIAKAKWQGYIDY